MSVRHPVRCSSNKSQHKLAFDLFFFLFLKNIFLFKIYLFNLFIFGCVGSLLLHVGFL